MELTTFNNIEVIAPKWSVPSQVLAFSTTRNGGVSAGAYRSLNLGLHVGDDPNLVLENRARILPAGHMQWLNQVHGNTVVEAHTTNRIPTADAMVCDKLGGFCAVMTADCVPIIIVDTKATRVGAIHAGWKGLVNGVIGNTVNKMNTTGSALVAWIGPSICASCYEVDNKVAKYFLPKYEDFCRPSSVNKWHLDLACVAKAQLVSKRVETHIDKGLCTYCNPEVFFSHRYATRFSKGVSGRQATVIGLL